MTYNHHLPKKETGAFATDHPQLTLILNLGFYLGTALCVRVYMHMYVCVYMNVHVYVTCVVYIYTQIKLVAICYDLDKVI